MSDVHVHLNRAREIQTDPFLFAEGSAHYIIERADEVAKQALLVLHHEITGNNDDNLVKARETVFRASSLNPVLLALLDNVLHIEDVQRQGVARLAGHYQLVDADYARRVFLVYAAAAVGIARGVLFRRL